MDVSTSQLQECLDLLEEQEASLLAWGDCDGFFSEEEILSVIKQTIPEHDSEEIKFELIEHAMLFQVPYQQGITAYRTRMGEAVHLYRNLRQWFHNQQLGQTRPLVSDYRFIRRPRTYPKRNLDPKELLKNWKVETNLNEVALKAMHLLLKPLDKFKLAGFQTRSTLRICKAWQYHSNTSHPRNVSTGTIVCAGTGSGKTLSFYLPALAMLVDDICKNPGSSVRILAIYPRKELLKDQFMETWSQCRKLDDLMLRNVGRKLRIGAFFGDTKYNLSSALTEARRSSGNSLPFDLLRCTTPNCIGSMVWPQDSIEKGRQELKCTNCQHRTGLDEVILTRQALTEQPPDILFTTTEMLNQHLGNNYQNHLFGIGYKTQGPPLVLMDEVHTYGGNTGAQTAFLLRRWMQRAWCRPHFVGLSATLVDAESFFAQLIGTSNSSVELVEPKEGEMEDKCAEYLLALRGDPVSQTALLSTTIQTAMLTRRILDPIQHGSSKGCWGSKSFIFTDDLDVNNRLYHQLSDAEGWRTHYQGSQPTGVPLANLRESDFNQQKIDLGQNWRMAQDIGHSLSIDDRAIVSRTSSQDAGVNATAEMVVATASLEVGFNDSLVGAVIQHKAPRDVSSYLQRKGRAGRPVDMRPWMIVVLSEFGRDRIAFQRYEDLINPKINRQGLPIHNNHIQKMQAAMATLDWLSSRMGKSAIWSVLKNPQKYQTQCFQLKELLDEILRPGELQEKYFEYLGWSLGITEKEILRILWTTPRSIMLEFLPTLHRLLVTNWREYGNQWGALNKNRSPLPQFIPDALFNKLNIPTLNISLRRGQNSTQVWQSLDFFQGLREFAPGRISKRYATSSNFEADWLVPNDFQPVVDSITRVPFEITEAFGDNLTFEGQVETSEGQILEVARPSEVYTRHLPVEFNLTETSNAFLQWHVSFSCTNKDAILHKMPKGSWQKCIQDICFYSHSQMTPLEVIRYNTGSLASLRFRNRGGSHVHFDWNKNGQNVAVGEKQWVDGVRFRFKIDTDVLTEMLSDSKILRALRPLYFRYCVGQLDYFENNSFNANWVSECFLASLAIELTTGGSTSGGEVLKKVQEALATLKTIEGNQELQIIPSSLFQPDENQLRERNSLHDELRSHLSNPMCLEQIHECAEIFWKDPKELTGFEEWLVSIIGNTMAGTAQNMLYVTLPDVEERAIVADAIWENDILEIWLTETEGGGSGVIDRIGALYYEDPINVLNIFVKCLEPCEYEQIDFDLYSLLEMLKKDSQLRQEVEELRSVQTHEKRRETIRTLLENLKNHGFAISHSFTSVLFSRVLRPGSSRSTDTDLLGLLRGWNNLEDTTGIEWPLNIVAHTLACSALDGDATPIQKFNQFCLNQGLLWQRGSEIRQSDIGYYNPFLNGFSLTERLLGTALFKDDTPKIIYETDDSLLDLHSAIRQFGKGDLVIKRTKISEISKVITKLQTEAIEHLGLLLYPRIKGVRRVKGDVYLRVEMAEMLH